MLGAEPLLSWEQKKEEVALRVHPSSGPGSAQGGSHWEVMYPPGYEPAWPKLTRAIGRPPCGHDTLCGLGLETPSAGAPSPGEGRQRAARCPQSFLPAGATLRGSSLEWPKAAGTAPGGESSFTLSRTVFLMAAGETFSWSAMDCSSLKGQRGGLSTRTRLLRAQVSTREEGARPTAQGQ